MSSVYEITTMKFIAAVEEQGYLPWQKPWQVRPQMNYLSKHAYNGANVWFTLLARQGSPYWLTFNQAKELGGYIKAGTKGIAIVFAGKQDKQDIETGEIGSKMVFRYFTVFNLAQIDGLVIPEEEESKRALVFDIKWLKENPEFPTIRFIGNSAFYSPDEDSITVPPMEQLKWESVEAFHAVLFHELSHATGHSKRLARELKSYEASPEQYSFEELIAEISAAICLSAFGLSHELVLNNSVAYTQGWLKKLSAQPDWLIKASSKAQASAEWIISRLTKGE